MPTVASISYALDNADQISPEYMDACSIQFMKAGIMGITLVVASGDNGIWGFQGYGTKFHSEFPASSPYVTSVGATNFATKSKIDSTSTWTCTGGGFSEYLTQPTWQSEAISSYLQLSRSRGLLPPTNYFNINGRGYPDVVSLGGQKNPYCISIGDGLFSGVSGTSASASIISAIITLLNNNRLNNNKNSLGFINPLLYENTQCFNDVSDYTKNSCLQGSYEGFAAIQGWDPATGLGMLNYDCLSKIA